MQGGANVAKSDQLWNFPGLAKFRSDLAKSLYLQKLRILAKSIQLRAAKNLASAEVIWPNWAPPRENHTKKDFSQLFEKIMYLIDVF